MSMDIASITSAFVQFGGEVIQKKLSKWDSVKQDFFIHRNLTQPKALTKIQALGNPRPYRTQDDFSGNDPKFSDRTLTAYQTKWDFQLDFEDLRNTYLSEVKGGLNPKTTSLTDYILSHFADSYLDKVNLQTIGLGVRNGSGTTAADFCNGIRTMIATEISGGGLTPIATGVIASTDAVTKVETFCDGLPAWLREMGFKIICSYGLFDKYKKHYRTLNAFGFQPNAIGKYQLDGLMGTLEPRAWMGTSSRLIAVPNLPVSSYDTVLHMGTNDNAIQVFATPHLNIIQIRMLMPIGLQISDLDAIFVNDQA